MTVGRHTMLEQGESNHSGSPELWVLGGRELVLRKVTPRSDVDCCRAVVPSDVSLVVNPSPVGNGADSSGEHHVQFLLVSIRDERPEVGV